MRQLTRSYLLRQLRRKGVVLARDYSLDELKRIWFQLTPGKQYEQMQLFRERERVKGGLAEPGGHRLGKARVVWCREPD